MTVLSVAQDVAPEIGVSVPNLVMASTEREMIELRAVIQETATRIARGHDWQLLTTEATVTGDGSAEAFSLPSDYDRQRTKSQVWSASLETPLTPIADPDTWLGLDIQSFDFVINAWIIYGGQIRIKPALASGVTAKYMYQSNLIIAPDSGANKARFKADTDTFRLDEQLLTLGTIWQWKAGKGQPYAEEMADYEELKARLVSRDRGSRSVRVGRVRYPYDVKTAYPQNVSP